MSQNEGCKIREEIILVSHFMIYLIDEIDFIDVKMFYETLSKGNQIFKFENICQNYPSEIFSEILRQSFDENFEILKEAFGMKILKKISQSFTKIYQNFLCFILDFYVKKISIKDERRDVKKNWSLSYFCIYLSNLLEKIE